MLIYFEWHYNHDVIVKKVIAAFQSLSANLDVIIFCPVLDICEKQKTIYYAVLSYNDKGLMVSYFEEMQNFDSIFGSSRQSIF